MKQIDLTRRALLLRGSRFALGAAALGGAFNRAIPALAAAGTSGLRGKTIGYVAFGLQFEYQVALVNEIKKSAQAKGANLEVVDGKGDPNLQTTELQDAVSKQPTAVLIDPVDPKLMIGGVAHANRSNIPVFVLENAPPTGSYEAIVSFHDERGGQLGANVLAKLIGGKGTVLECRGAIGSTQSDLRYKGFNEQAKAKYPNMKVDTLKTDWVADKALTLVLDAFTRNSDIAGIWSHNDEMLRGVESALRQINRLKPAGTPGHIPVVGLDGTPIALQRIRSGIQDASIGQDPFAMGDEIVNAMEAFFAKQSFSKVRLIEPVIITKSNASDSKLWGNRK